MVSNQLDLLRLGAYSQTEALLILDRLGRDLERLLRVRNITAFQRARVNKLLRDATDVIDRYYEDIHRSIDRNLAGAARATAVGTAEAMTGAVLLVGLEATIPPEKVIRALLDDTLIQGAKSAQWWSRQSKDVAFRFATVVRSGIVRGETNEDIVRRVVGTTTAPGVMTIARHNVRTLVHTSVQAVANEARRETFQANRDIAKGIRQLSTLDGRTTPVCIAYSGQTWDLDGAPMGQTVLPYNGGTPRHWNCRSIEVPILLTFRELGIDLDEVPVGGRATAGGPVRGDLTMREWLHSRTKEQLDDQLGPGRAALFRQGKITLQQLLDLKGNPLTLTQLERKYARR